ncbi:hypothetical protein HZA87_01100 [Candidatus Uhrbacteria bacterium]|nr:hypothetical protein [Candidatus Uhrbacteria bacterium]
MRYYHRHSFFPLVIILLTLLLGVFMLLTVSRQTAPPADEQTTTPVDAQAYRVSLVDLLTTFEAGIALAPDDPAKLVVAERALTDLLALRVPPEDKQLHLDFALTLTKIQTALKSDDTNIDAFLLEIQTIKGGL